MTPDVHSPDDEETEVILPSSSKLQAVITESTNGTSSKNRKESLRDFLRTLGSVASLPGEKGKPFSTSRGIFHQCLATFAIFVMTAGVGQPIGLSAILLPQLYVENSTMHIDVEMGSWIASVHSVATPFGSFTGGMMAEYFGRLRTLQISILPMILGWLVITFSPMISVLLLGRILCGFSVGIVAATGSVYLGEISDPKMRGLLGGTMFVSYSLGVLIIYMIGSIPWRHVAAYGTILPAVAFFILLKMPESPDWLARNGKLTQAHKSVVWLRGDELLAKKEVHMIMTKSARERDGAKETIWQALRKPVVAKPMFIINIFNILQSLTGTYMVIFYAVDIIKAIGIDSIDNITAAIYSAVIRCIFTIVGCFMLYHMNRRSIILISSIGSAIGSLALGGFLMSKTEFEDSSTKMWIAGVCLLVYISSNTVGIMMLPGVMVGELLPAKERGVCGGYIFTFFNLCLFAFTKIFPFIKNTIDIDGMFLIFGVSSLIISVFMFLVFPETKNKTFLEIERYFEENGLLWITRKRSSSDGHV